MRNTLLFLVTVGACSTVALGNPVPLPVRTLGPSSAGVLTSLKRAKPTFAWSDSFQLLTQTLPPLNSELVAFGDTDHDGKNEFIIPVRFGTTFDYRILELQANGTYLQSFVGPFIYPSAAGDLDGDGRSEVLGQQSNRLFVYESPNTTTHPSILAWQSPPLTNIIGFPTIADTDCDGRQEIIHSINTLGTSRLVIYENTGDNAFSQVFFQIESAQDAGPKVVADLDGDGRPEIAHGGTYGYLHIYESSVDNVWQQTFFDSTGLDNAYGIAGGVDTDGNGKPELFVTGDSQDVPGERNTFVYEAVGDNCIARVAIIRYFDGHRGGIRSCVGNVDGVGLDEFVLDVYPDRSLLLIYRAVAPGHWILASTISDPDPSVGHGSPFAFDANQNKRDEIFWTGGGDANFSSTWVLERLPALATDVLPDIAFDAQRLVLLPNPCRTAAGLLVSDRLRVLGRRVATFDASGRLLSKVIIDDRGSLRWSPGRLGPGTYFVQLEDANGTPLAHGRVTVVR